MIKLTDRKGSPFYINPDAISAVIIPDNNPDRAAISVGGAFYEVSQTQEQVVNLIREQNQAARQAFSNELLKRMLDRDDGTP